IVLQLALHLLGPVHRDHLTPREALDRARPQRPGPMPPGARLRAPARGIAALAVADLQRAAPERRDRRDPLQHQPARLLQLTELHPGVVPDHDTLLNN